MASYITIQQICTLRDILHETGYKWLCTVTYEQQMYMYISSKW